MNTDVFLDARQFDAGRGIVIALGLSGAFWCLCGLAVWAVW